MRKSNIFLPAMILSALLLSACTGGNSSIAPETAVTNPPDVLQTSAERPAETTMSEWDPSDYVVIPPTDENISTVTFIDDEFFITNYFNENGFRYADYTIYVDMDKFPDTDDPFENIKKGYIDHANSIVLSNADGRDINFVNDTSTWSLTINDYSGKCDLSNIDQIIYFDNYMGGDISTISERNDVLRFINYKGGYDLSAIADIQNVYGVEFDNYNSEDDLQFIKECKNLTYLWLENDDIDCEKLAEILKGTNINEMFMRTGNYRGSDMDILAKALPTVKINYQEDDSGFYNYKAPSEGLVFCTNGILTVDQWAEKPELKTDHEIYDLTSSETWGLWNWNGELICLFSNYTGTDKTVKSAKLYREKDGELIETPFADGNFSYEINAVIKAGMGSDIEIPEELLSAKNTKAGIYKIEFDTDDGNISMRFFISSDSLDFLTDEQRQAYDKAYEIMSKYFLLGHHMDKSYINTHTAEDFLAELYEGLTYDYAHFLSDGIYIDENGELIEVDADGGNIVYMGSCYEPIYSDENEVIFKRINFYGHSDFSYFLWVGSKNYHMVMTEDGWRFDNFPDAC